MGEMEVGFGKIMELANRHNVNAIQDFLADDLVFLNTVTGSSDRRGMHDWHEALFRAFPDLAFSLQRTVSQGHTLVAECKAKGTQIRELLGIAGTNKKVEIPVAFVLDFRENKISRWSSYFDVAGMLRQLGVAR